MKNKLIFFNTGWMDFYKGQGKDKLQGGGKHVEREGWGGEIFNFKNFNGKVYGYVQPKIDRQNETPSTIKLEKIEQSCYEDYLENVTVVWTATDPINRGTYIVGWYLNATIFRYEEDAPRGVNRKFESKIFGYFCTAKFKDATLLHKDERILKVKRQAKNWMGQSNVWYADKNPEFVKLVKDYIFKNIVPNEPAPKGNPKGGKARQPDVLKRSEVESNAIKIISNHYHQLGYFVDSVERDNVGWDLTASNTRQELKLEVKGLSGSQYIADLTPNEFTNLNKYLSTYRVCIVIEALSKKPKFKIFAYSIDTNNWVDEEGTILNISIIESARVFV